MISSEYLKKSLALLDFCRSTLSRLLRKNGYFGLYGSLLYKLIPSVVIGLWFIGVSKEFVFPNPELPLINVLYGWSKIFGQSGLYSFMSSFEV